MPKLVLIGGGTGMPVLLRGIKKYDVDITAIVTVADDGGSSGKLRHDLHIPPPGDIRNCLAALSHVEPLVVEMFQHRFHTTTGDLSGHSLGNLILAAMTNITGDFASAVKELSRVLNVKGRVLPSTDQIVVLNAEMEDGTVVSGESSIPKYGKKIKRVFLSPEQIQPLPEAIEAILAADMIVIGPGSLYTSILPNLLVPGIGKAVKVSRAQKVYICNLMTQNGETNDYTASDHVKALYRHLEQPFLQKIIINNRQIPEYVKLRYKGEDAIPVIMDEENLLALNLEIISRPIASIEEGVIRHDAEKVAQIIYQLLSEEGESTIST